jgi:hypothetical protein
MKWFFPLLILGVFLASCREEDAGPTEGINLRIQNRSVYTFDEVYVVTRGDGQTYDKLLPGGTSSYKGFDVLYRYAFIRIKSGNKEYILQPIDYFGETPLPEGNYTYVLGIDDPDDTYGVSLEFRED